MKTNTNRFETVLPDSLRRRYRAPRGPEVCEKPNAEQSSRKKSSGNSWPSADFDPKKLGTGNGAAIATKPKVDTSPWFIAGGITVFIGLAATAHILAGFADKADALRYTHETVPTPTPAPIPVMTPVATPAPIPVAIPAAPEVRRAEPVPAPTFRLAHMPDGSSLAVRILGAFTRQEELPLTGNVVGDAYYVGRFPFVWTQLANGQGAWIDPRIE